MRCVRSCAPLRLGLAGGGTDLDSYSREEGGAVLNATIRKYVYCMIYPSAESTIAFEAPDMDASFQIASANTIPFSADDPFLLHKGVYNRIVSEYCKEPALSFSMATYSEVPVGSGLGSSSTLVVAMIKAYTEWLNLPIDNYEMAQLAYSIERDDLCLPGGKQDQYAATFGGFNYIEFLKDGTTIVNPLQVKNWVLHELESSLVLYYTGISRKSTQIIDEQTKRIQQHDAQASQGMRDLKREAHEMKTCLLRADFDGIAQCLERGWAAKKKTSNLISDDKVECLYRMIAEHGGKAAKISGAGGGGFMMILCDPAKRYSLMKALDEIDDAGHVSSVHFYERGAQAWTLS